MTLILSSAVSLFACLTNQPGDEQNFREQPNNADTGKGTPVYESDIDHQVAILETDYPEVAAKFSAAANVISHDSRCEATLY